MKKLDVIGVTVFGRAPFDGARRMIGIDGDGKAIFGTPEKKGSISPGHLPMTKAKSPRRKR